MRSGAIPRGAGAADSGCAPTSAVGCTDDAPCSPLSLDRDHLHDVLMRRDLDRDLRLRLMVVEAPEDLSALLGFRLLARCRAGHLRWVGPMPAAPHRAVNGGPRARKGSSARGLRTRTEVVPSR